MRKQRPLLSYVTDSREQNPYAFSSCQRPDLDFGGSFVYKLDEGDYSVELEANLLPVRIERKSLTDLFACVGRERERFEAELERLRQYKAYLMIEATAAQVAHGIERSHVSGKAAMCSVLCWSVRFGIAPIFAGTWRFGNAMAQRILEEFAVHYAGD